VSSGKKEEVSRRSAWSLTQPATESQTRDLRQRGVEQGHARAARFLQQMARFFPVLSEDNPVTPSGEVSG